MDPIMDRIAFESTEAARGSLVYLVPCIRSAKVASCMWPGESAEKSNAAMAQVVGREILAETPLPSICRPAMCV